MSRRLAEATSRFLAQHTPRRGFLSKTAVVGSAFVVAPRQFITKPATAYERVCNCGANCDCSSLCCDGYTELCCTIYGNNGCPPGSLYGGWWRVSASNFCGGSNRYYLDCHNPCGGCSCGASGICSGSCNGTACGCALGSCKNRKAGCTHFRYGQCNQQHKCLGPIICRAISCTPPWQLEPTCTTSIRTDNATRDHHRSCLQEFGNAPVGAFDVVTGQSGAITVRGWAIDPDVLGAIDVLIQVSGSPVASVTADRPRPDVGAAYGAYGDEHGFDFTFASTIGTKEVCVLAINNGGGPNRLLGCKLVKVAAPAATGVLEAAVATSGGVDVSGWAFVEGSTVSLDIDLFVDEVHTATVPANVARADMASTFGSAGKRHGFAATLDLGSGAHTICASVTDPETGAVLSLGCTTVQSTASLQPHGTVDKISGDGETARVVGWLLDPDGGDATVAVLVDGVEMARTTADQGRPDVATVHPEAATTGGFDIVVPLTAPGGHNVCVYSFGSDGEPGPVLGCATVT